MIRTLFRSNLSRQSLQQRSISSTAVNRNAAQTAKSGQQQLEKFADKAKQMAGPVGQKLQSMLGGYADPIVYNLKVVGHIAKQVYIAESLAPPKSFGVVQDAYRTLYSRAVDASWWTKLIQSGQWRRVGIYAVEAYGIWTIGEMVSVSSIALELHLQGGRFCFLRKASLTLSSPFSWSPRLDDALWWDTSLTLTDTDTTKLAAERRRREHVLGQRALGDDGPTKRKQAITLVHLDSAPSSPAMH